MTLRPGEKSLTPTGNPNNYYTKEEVNTALAGKASTSLDNLTADGQMIIDSQNGTISNCILDIPQNLNLELSGNILTAKSGSVLTDSGSTYQTITLITDKTLEIPNTADLKRMVFATSSGTLSLATFSSCVSGATDSLAGVPYHIWFDTSNQEVNYYGSDGITASHRTYPLCIIETDANGVANFAKDSNGNYMIFNGAGFIGNYAFVYPGIKLLSPMGLDDVGKLKSELIVTNSLTIVALGSRNSICCYNSTTLAARNYLGEYKTIEEAPTNISSGIPVVYISGENKGYQFSNNQWSTSAQQQRAIVLIKYTTSGTTVTDFVIRQPVRTATAEMLDRKQADLTTVSGYDATATQTLKHINGILTWVTEA